MAEKATKALPDGWTTHAGLPSAGLVKERPRPTGTDDTAPTAVPDAAPGVAFEPGGEVDGDGAIGFVGVALWLVVPPIARPMMAVMPPRMSAKVPTTAAAVPLTTTMRRSSSSRTRVGNVSWTGKTGHPDRRVQRPSAVSPHFLPRAQSF